MTISIKTNKTYTLLFIMIALCQLYINSFRVNIVLQLAVAMFCFLHQPVSLSKKAWQHIAVLGFVLLMGFAGTLLHGYSISNILKDLMHFLKPITGLFLGYVLFKRIGDFRRFAQTVVIASILTAVIHLCIIFLLTDFSSGAIEKIRYYTKDNFLELFGLFLLIYFPKFEGIEVFDNNKYKKLWLGLILFSSFLYFSRTMFIIAALLWLTMKGYTRITKSSLQIIGTIVLMVVLLYTYLYNTNIKRGAAGFEGFLYKIKIVPEEIFTFNIDRNNHAELWDHWRGYEAKRALELMEQHPSSYVFGTGHGSFVDLKFYTPLQGNPKGIRYISELHNGYVYILYKTGSIGVLAYLFLLLRWYAYIYKKRNLKNVLISAGGIIFLLTTVMITGLYNSKDIIIFIIGGVFYFASKNKLAAKTDDDSELLTN